MIPPFYMLSVCPPPFALSGLPITFPLFFVKADYLAFWFLSSFPFPLFLFTFTQKHSISLISTIQSTLIIYYGSCNLQNQYPVIALGTNQQFDTPIETWRTKKECEERISIHSDGCRWVLSACYDSHFQKLTCFAIGASGTGRTTFVNTLCDSNVLAKKICDNPEEAHNEEGITIKPVSVGKSKQTCNFLKGKDICSPWQRTHLPSPYTSLLEIYLPSRYLYGLSFPPYLSRFWFALPLLLYHSIVVELDEDGVR